MRFKDRTEAGVMLALKLLKYRQDKPIIFALPRGGVPVGYEVAQKLNAPLDLVITRKIGHPTNPEYAVCAVAEDGTLLCDEARRSSLDPEWLERAVDNERKEAARRRRAYLPGRAHISIADKTAIVVDDGIATGLTIRAAVQSIRKEGPAKLVVAVPVAPHDVVEMLRKETDSVVVLEDAKNYLGAVGAYYSDFPQTTDEEVLYYLNKRNNSN